MDAATIGVAITLVMVVLSILGMAFVGLKSLVTKERDWTKIVILIIPFIIFAVAMLVTSNSDVAAMWTTLIMLGIMAVLLSYSAIKSALNL